MALLLGGIGVSRGIAIGPARLLRYGEFDIAEYVLPATLVHEEIARYRRALNTAREELRAIRSSIPASVPSEIAEFIDTHLLMLEDSAFSRSPSKSSNDVTATRSGP